MAANAITSVREYWKAGRMRHVPISLLIEVLGVELERKSCDGHCTANKHKWFKEGFYKQNQDELEYIFYDVRCALRAKLRNCHPNDVSVLNAIFEAIKRRFYRWNPKLAER